MEQAFNVHFAAEVKKLYPDLLVATVGSIKDPAMAEEIIASGKADIVAMNRALHADYDMPRKYAEGREWEHMPCLRCRCFRMASPHTSKLCSVNAIWGRYKEYPEGKLPRAAVKKKVAVIGGGPAGVEAMKWLLQRGPDVTLYEKSGRIGGHVRDAVSAPFKKDMRDYLGYMESFAENCGARVLLNTEATPELLNGEKFDAIVAALGAEPIFPKLPGADKPHVHGAPDAENGSVACGAHVVIIGGSSVGTEASINIAMKGAKVTVLEMVKEVDLSGTGAGSDLLDLSAENGVTRLLGWRLLEILDNSVVAENVDTGEKKEFAADTVLMAVGLKPRRAEAMKFWHCCPETNFAIIGDCAESGDIRDAVWTAFEATRYI
jgi:NADPH-dependent 2,4-dienoyl-CoA reductase/sulfur reductase-like enzyme